MSKLIVSFLIILFSYSFVEADNYVSNEIIVKLKDPVNLTPFLNQYSNFNLDTAQCLSETNCTWVFTFDTTLTYSDSLFTILESDTLVNKYFKNILLTPQQCSDCETSPVFSDELYCGQYHLKNYEQNPNYLNLMNCPLKKFDIDGDLALQKLGYSNNSHPNLQNPRGDNIVVAVFDKGFHINNNDINFIEGFDFNTQSSNMSSNGHHGTFVSSILGSKANSNGIIGVLPGIDIMPIDVGVDGVDAPDSHKISTLFNAIDTVIARRKRYNDSWGKGTREGNFIVAINYSATYIHGKGENDPETQDLINLRTEFSNKINELAEVGVIFSGITTNGSIGGTVEERWDFPAIVDNDFIIITNQSSSSGKPIDDLGKGTISTISVDLNAPSSPILGYTSENNIGLDAGNSYSAPQTTAVFSSFFVRGNSNFYHHYFLNPKSTLLQLKNFILNSVEIYSNHSQINATSGILNYNGAIELFDDVYNVVGCSDQTITEIYSKLYSVNDNISPNDGDFMHFGNNPSINQSVYFPSKSNAKVKYDGNGYPEEISYFSKGILQLGSGYVGSSDTYEFKSEINPIYDEYEININFSSCNEVRLKGCLKIGQGVNATFGIKNNPDNEWATGNGYTLDENCNNYYKQANFQDNKLISYFGFNPNPVSNVFDIEFETFEPNLNLTIEILNLQGNILITRNFQSRLGFNNEQFDISQLPSGNYFLRCTINKEHLFSDKIVLIK